MLGNPDRRGDASDPISRGYFDVPRELGSVDNSLKTALDKVSMDEFMVATDGSHQKWFNVRVETQHLLAWLRATFSESACDTAPVVGNWPPNSRDNLIDRVRRGEITPDEAEAKAKQKGFEPFETKPEPLEFDPEKLSWWSLPMALAWIAWRDTKYVREHCAEYRVNCYFWAPISWNVPINGGKESKRINGHELKTVQTASVQRLKLHENYMHSYGELPNQTQMSVVEAQRELFDALGAGQIVAVAKDAAGKVVDIPQREWPFLKLSEDWERDTFDYRDFNLQPTFTDVVLKRDDVKQLWAEFVVQPYMLEPMTRPDTAGYVPLCSVLHWIMSDAGSVKRNLEDAESWNASVERLLPLISSGEIEIIGKPTSGGPAERVDGHIFANISVSHPSHDSVSSLSNDDAWVSCTPYVNAQYWGNTFNDQIFLRRASPAAWTHLQVKKNDVLREFVFPKTDASRADSYNVGGRPEEYNWEQIKAFAFHLIQENGVPSKQNKKLPTKQALIEAICGEWDKRDIVLPHPTVRRHLNKWLNEMKPV